LVHGSTLDGNQYTTSSEADTNFADESICLLADNVQNEVVTIHIPQVVLKMLPPPPHHVDILRTRGRGSDLPFEDVLREYLQFPYK
jgi:hypothetical protein